MAETGQSTSPTPRAQRDVHITLRRLPPPTLRTRGANRKSGGKEASFFSLNLVVTMADCSEPSGIGSLVRHATKAQGQLMNIPGQRQHSGVRLARRCPQLQLTA